MTLLDIFQQFPDESACLDYLEKLRWPSGIACVECGVVERITTITRKGKTGKEQRIYQCNDCRTQFSAKSGTIFHRSHLPLQKWFLAIAIMVDAKKGVSANQMKRHLGVTYKTAWYLCHRIREAMKDGSTNLLTGVVEVDETFMGGRYDRRRKNSREKTPVVGLVQRGGKVEAKKIPTPSAKVLVGIIRDRVHPLAHVMTDDSPSYKRLKKVGYRHDTVNHSALEYARGEVYTNTIENFWSLLKRGVLGNFHKVSVKHLNRYLNEFTYRYNLRDLADLFAVIVGNLAHGERLEYSDLIAKKGTPV